MKESKHQEPERWEKSRKEAPAYKLCKSVLSVAIHEAETIQLHVYRLDMPQFATMFCIKVIELLNFLHHF